MSTQKKSYLISECFKWEAKKQGVKKLTQKVLADNWNLPPSRINDFLQLKRQINIKMLIFIKERYNKPWSTIGKLLEKDFK